MHQAGAAGVAAALLVIARLCVAGVFIRAGSVKLADLDEFRLAVTNYQILPAGLVAAVAVGLPAVETAAGVLLLLGVLSWVVAAVLAALLACFAAAIALNLARGRVFDCGCGGSTAPQLISWRHVAVNVVLVAVAAALSIAPPSGVELLHGSPGLVTLAVPAGSALPLVLASALTFLAVRVLGAALAVRSSLLD